MQSRNKLFNPALPQRNLGRVLKFALFGIATLCIGATAVWMSACPCERLPGVYLSGERIEQPVENWAFANQVPLCQIQTNTGLIPHALNLNCAADTNGDLYLSCAQCEGKRWSTAALQNPDAYIRLDGKVYPISLRKLDDSSELDNAWRSRAIKLASLRGITSNEIPERPDHWWSFQVTSRS